MARTLDGKRDGTLMTRAGSILAARFDLALVVQEATHRVGIFIVQLLVFVFAERARLLDRRVAPASS